jgi:NADPH2 dehydrogenase
VAEYYSQRSSVSGTLLIAEATFIAPQAGGYPNIPGIYSDAQIVAWKKVTDAVHANGSFFFLQLWGLGRTANPDFLNMESGTIVKSVSDVPMKDGAVPAPLTEEEIWKYIGYYKQAAKNAISAGFDGVELHGASGYLIDQFIQDVTNKRTDAWGGSVEKRARFGIEVATAVVNAVGAERTAIRLSPYSKFNGMGMKSKCLGESYLHS